MRDCRIIERTWTHGGFVDAMFFKIQRKRNRFALFDAGRIVVALDYDKIMGLFLCSIGWIVSDLLFLVARFQRLTLSGRFLPRDFTFKLTITPRPLHVSITANYRYRRGKISLRCSFFVRLALQGGWSACLSKNHHHYVLKFSSPQNNWKYSEILAWMGRIRMSRVYGDFTSTYLYGESLLVDWFRENSSFRSPSSVSFWFSWYLRSRINIEENERLKTLQLENVWLIRYSIILNRLSISAVSSSIEIIDKDKNIRLLRSRRDNISFVEGNEFCKLAALWIRVHCNLSP